MKLQRDPQVKVVWIHPIDDDGSQLQELSLGPKLLPGEPDGGETIEWFCWVTMRGSDQVDGSGALAGRDAAQKAAAKHFEAVNRPDIASLVRGRIA